MINSRWNYSVFFSCNVEGGKQALKSTKLIRKCVFLLSSKVRNSVISGICNERPLLVNASEFVCQKAFSFISKFYSAFIVLFVALYISRALIVPSLDVWMVVQLGSNMLEEKFSVIIS